MFFYSATLPQTTPGLLSQNTNQTINTKTQPNTINAKEINNIQAGDNIKGIIQNGTTIQQGFEINNGLQFEDDVFYQIEPGIIVEANTISNNSKEKFIVSQDFVVQKGILLPLSNNSITYNTIFEGSVKNTQGVLPNNIVLPSGTIVESGVLIQSGATFLAGSQIQSGVLFDFDIYYLSKINDEIVVNKFIEQNQLTNIFKNKQYIFKTNTLLQNGFIFNNEYQFILSPHTLFNLTNSKTLSLGVDLDSKIPILGIPENSIIKNGVTISSGSFIENNVQIQAGVTIEKNVLFNFNAYYITAATENQPQLISKIEALTPTTETLNTYGEIITNNNIVFSASQTINIPLLSSMILPAMTILGPKSVVPENTIFSNMITVQSGAQVSTKQKIANNPFFPSANFEPGIQWFDNIYSDNTNSNSIQGTTIGGTTIGGTISGGTVIQGSTSGGSIIGGVISSGQISNVNLTGGNSNNVTLLNATITNGENSGGITYYGNNNSIKYGINNGGILNSTKKSPVKTQNVSIANSSVSQGIIQNATINNVDISNANIQNISVNGQNFASINQVGITNGIITIANNQVTLKSGKLLSNYNTQMDDEKNNTDLINNQIATGGILSNGQITNGTIEGITMNGQISGEKSGGVSTGGQITGGTTTGGIIENLNTNTIMNGITKGGFTTGGVFSGVYNCNQGNITSGKITKGTIREKQIFDCNFQNTKIANLLVEKAIITGGTTFNGTTTGGSIINTENQKIQNTNTIINGIVTGGIVTSDSTTIANITSAKSSNALINQAVLSAVNIKNCTIASISTANNSTTENTVKNADVTNGSIFLNENLGYIITSGTVTINGKKDEITYGILLNGEITSGDIQSAKLITGNISGDFNNLKTTGGTNNGGNLSGGYFASDGIIYWRTPIQSGDTILNIVSDDGGGTLVNYGINNNLYTSNLEMNTGNLIQAGVVIPENININSGVFIQGPNDFMLNYYYYLNNNNQITRITNYKTPNQIAINDNITVQNGILFTYNQNDILGPDTILINNTEQLTGVLPSDMIIPGGNILSIGLILKNGLILKKNNMFNFNTYYFTNSNTITNCLGNVNSPVKINNDIQIAEDIILSKNILLLNNYLDNNLWTKLNNFALNAETSVVNTPKPSSIFDIEILLPPVKNVTLSITGESQAQNQESLYKNSTISSGVTANNLNLSAVNVSSDAVLNNCETTGINLFGTNTTNASAFLSTVGKILPGAILPQNIVLSKTQDDIIQTESYLQNNTQIDIAALEQINNVIVGENLGWGGTINENNQGFVKANDSVTSAAKIENIILNSNIYGNNDNYAGVINQKKANTYNSKINLPPIGSNKNNMIIANNVYLTNGIIQPNTVNSVVSTQNVAIFRDELCFAFDVYYLNQNNNTISKLPAKSNIASIFSNLQTIPANQILITYDNTFLCPNILLIQPKVNNSIIDQPIISPTTKYENSPGKFVAIGNQLDNTLPFIIPSGFKISGNMIIQPTANIQGNVEIDDNCIIVVDNTYVAQLQTNNTSNPYENAAIVPISSETQRQLNLGYFYYNAGTSVPKGSSIGKVFWIGSIHSGLPILPDQIIGLSYENFKNSVEQNYSFFTTDNNLINNANTQILNRELPSEILSYPTSILKNTNIPSGCIVQSAENNPTAFRSGASFSNGAIISINCTGLEYLRKTIQNGVTKGGVTNGGSLISGAITQGSISSSSVYFNGNTPTLTPSPTKNTDGTQNFSNVNISGAILTNVTLTQPAISQSLIVNGLTTNAVTTSGDNTISNGFTTGGITQYGTTYCDQITNLVIQNATIQNASIINASLSKNGALLSGTLQSGTLTIGEINMPILIDTNPVNLNLKIQNSLSISNGTINTEKYTPLTNYTISTQNLTTTGNNKITTNLSSDNALYKELQPIVQTTQTNYNDNDNNQNISWFGAFNANSNAYLAAGDTIGPFANSATINGSVVFPSNINFNYINLNNRYSGITVNANSTFTNNTTFSLASDAIDALFVIVINDSNSVTQNSLAQTFISNIEEVFQNKTLLTGFITSNVPLKNNALIGDFANIVTSTEDNQSFINNLEIAVKNHGVGGKNPGVRWCGKILNQLYQTALNNSSSQSIIGNSDQSALAVENLTINNKIIESGVTIGSTCVLNHCVLNGENITIQSGAVIEYSSISSNVNIGENCTFKGCTLSNCTITSGCILDSCILQNGVTIANGVYLNTNCVFTGLTRENPSSTSIQWFGVFDSQFNTQLQHFESQDTIASSNNFQKQVNFNYILNTNNTILALYNILTKPRSFNVTWVGTGIYGNVLVQTGDFISGTVILDPHSKTYHTILGTEVKVSQNEEITITNAKNSTTQTVSAKDFWGLPLYIKRTNLPSGIFINAGSILPIEFIQETYQTGQNNILKFLGNVTWYGNYIYQLSTNTLIQNGDSIWGRIIMYPTSKAQDLMGNIAITPMALWNRLSQLLTAGVIHTEFTTGIVNNVHILQNSQVCLQFFIDNKISINDVQVGKNLSNTSKITMDNSAVVYGQDIASSNIDFNKIQNGENTILNDYYISILGFIMDKMNFIQLENGINLQNNPNLCKYAGWFSLVDSMGNITNLPICFINQNNFFGCNILISKEYNFLDFINVEICIANLFAAYCSLLFTSMKVVIGETSAKDYRKNILNLMTQSAVIETYTWWIDPIFNNVSTNNVETGAWTIPDMSRFSNFFGDSYSLNNIIVYINDNINNNIMPYSIYTYPQLTSTQVYNQQQNVNSQFNTDFSNPDNLNNTSN